VSSPSVGVQAFSVSGATTNAASTSSNSNTSTTSTSNKQVFSSQINLEAPSSVLPPSITPLSASSITSPSSLLIVTPNAGDVSSIAAPGSSVPSVGITPSSGASTVVPPSGSVNDPTSSVTPPGGSSGAIVPPGGISTKKTSDDEISPFGYYDGSGNCQEGPQAECRTTNNLQEENEILERKVANGTASPYQQLELARNRAQIQLRKLMGNDRVGDEAFNELHASSLLTGYADNGGRLQGQLSIAIEANFWNQLALDIKTNVLEREDIPNLIWFAKEHVVEWDADGKPYFFRWNPRLGIDVPLVFDLPGGSPFFVNGNPRELNSRLNWVTAGFLSSAFGGWNPSDYRKTVLDGNTLGKGGFVESKCRHPALNKPSGNMPVSEPGYNVDPTTGKKYPFPLNGDINTNILIAQNKAKEYSWFTTQQKFEWFQGIIATNRPWDFKNWGPGKGNYPYEDYGNFMYGAVGSALGISPVTLHRAAGFTQTTSGFGYRSPNKIAIGSPEVFGPPYSYSSSDGAFGDDPKDFYWIQLGISYYKSDCY
jgi:Bacterial toxin 44